MTGRVALALALAAGVAACTASPRYPIDAREAPGSGGLTPWQPRYPVSRRDAAQDARDAADGSAIPPRDGTYAPPPPPAAVGQPPPGAADDDAPRRLPSSGVDSADLPPPNAAPHLMSETDPPSLPPGVVLATYETSTDATGAGIELAAYRHHHRRRRKDIAKPGDDTAAAAGEAPRLRGAADTPFETTVRPGEKLAEVARRLNTTREALIQLNGLKHPRHVRAGTVLKAPYRYSYDVQKGDTLYTIARRFNQDPNAVAKLNGLKHAAALQPGQTVQLPPTLEDKGVRPHAVAALKPEAAPERMIQAALRRAELEDRRRARHGRRAKAVQEAASAPASHRGESAADEVAADAVAARGRRPAESRTPYVQQPPAVATAAPRPAMAASSQPGSSEARPPASPSTASAPVATAEPGHPIPSEPGAVATLNAPTYRPSYPAGSAYAPSLGRPRAPSEAPAAGPLSATDIAEAGRGRFVWPLRGSLISGFGDHGAQHNDGMDLAVQTGEGVHAAAAGEVVYAGSSIPGFGNLVLVKHAGGWVTAYAHLDRIEVRMRDEVTQGEEIGQAGQTGAVDRPLLHFEVRYAPQPTDKARPVDPALVLPAG